MAKDEDWGLGLPKNIDFGLPWKEKRNQAGSSETSFDGIEKLINAGELDEAEDRLGLLSGLSRTDTGKEQFYLARIDAERGYYFAAKYRIDNAIRHVPNHPVYRRFKRNLLPEFALEVLWNAFVKPALVLGTAAFLVYNSARLGSHLAEKYYLPENSYTSGESGE